MIRYNGKLGQWQMYNGNGWVQVDRLSALQMIEQDAADMDIIVTMQAEPMM
jgi:hypothetical protein